MKNVLLLTDSTPKSTNAHHYACKLLTGQPCSYYFLSIQKIWEYTMDDLMVASYDSIDDALLGDNRKKNDAQINTFKEEYASEDYSFQGLVDYDDFIHSVNQAVDKYEIDLIVIGTDGKTGIIETIFSSHTLRLVRNVDKPILIIPEDYKYQQPKKIQYLLDYDDSFEACGKDLMIEIKQRFTSRLHFYRLTFGKEFDYQTNEIEQKVISKAFPEDEIRYQTFIDGNPEKVLLKSLLQEPPQLIILSAKKQTFLERLFLKSHLSQIVNVAPLPLLLLRDCTEDNQ